MYSLLNYIVKLITQYTTLSNLYIIEFSKDISILDFYNSLILFSIFLYLFIRFLIKFYTFKRVVYFILTRLSLATLFFLYIYLLSNFTLCETPITKGIGQYITTDKMKHICIATITITGCLLGYKYIPILYNNLKDYNNYRSFIINKRDFDNKNSLYLECLKTRELNHFKYVSESHSYITLCKNFNMLIHHFLANNGVVLKSYLSFCGNKDIVAINSFLKNYKFYHDINEINTIDYNFKLKVFITNYDKLQDIFFQLKTGNKYYTIDYEIMATNQMKLFDDIKCLFNFYGKELFPFFKTHLNKNGWLKNPELLNNVDFNNKLVYLGNTLDIYINNVIASSNIVVGSMEHVLNVSLVLEPPILHYSDIIVLKQPVPPVINPIEFPIDNLSGIKFISINLSYIFFYPLLYCSNKIFGTVNPLKQSLFTEAFKNLFSGSGFF